MNYSTIRLDAGHDKNGNPRRVFVTIADGDIIATYDEGYQGKDAITEPYHKDIYNGLTFETTPSEYRSLIKFENFKLKT